jgi:hypothetical protein
VSPLKGGPLLSQPRPGGATVRLRHYDLPSQSFKNNDLRDVLASFWCDTTIYRRKPPAGLGSRRSGARGRPWRSRRSSPLAGAEIGRTQRLAGPGAGGAGLSPARSKRDVIRMISGRRRITCFDEFARLPVAVRQLNPLQESLRHPVQHQLTDPFSV